MGPFEPNEMLAFVFVLLALVITAVVRAHPANTERTRAWWGRFLVVLALLLVAELATNVEQLWPDDSPTREVLNMLEHLGLLMAGGWALLIAVRSLVEGQQRKVAAEEVTEGGGDHSGN